MTIKESTKNDEDSNNNYMYTMPVCLQPSNDKNKHISSD